MNDRAVRLDPIDIRILDLLQRNGRISNVKLAEAVGLSESPCQERMKRLERAGYILSYGAKIELAQIGEVITVFAEIELTSHSATALERFENAVTRVDEAMECYRIGCDYDYLVKFVARGPAHFQDVMQSLLDREIGIASYSTLVVLKTPIRKPGGSLTTLLPRLRVA